MQRLARLKQARQFGPRQTRVALAKPIFIDLALDPVLRIRLGRRVMLWRNWP
jgi:hypothetical protein